MSPMLPRIGAWSAVFAIAAGYAACALAQGDQAAYARSLAATCFTCHGTDGRSAGGVPPGLAGRNRDGLLQQLRDFKAGRRPSTIMRQQLAGYTEEQLERIAAYFAAVKPEVAPDAQEDRGKAPPWR